MAAYDRTTLRAAAERRGDNRPDDLRRRLADNGITIGRMTAWRLWHGTAAPSGAVTAGVHRVYCVSPDDLLVPADVTEDAA